MLGGADIGYFVGFLGAGGAYILFERARGPLAAAARQTPQPEGLVG
jgi:hypothetical protein